MGVIVGSSETSIVTPQFLFRFWCAMVSAAKNAVLGGGKIIIPPPGDKQKWKNDVFWVCGR